MKLLRLCHPHKGAAFVFRALYTADKKAERKLLTPTLLGFIMSASTTVLIFGRKYKFV